jgi:hypothetical protein
MTAYRRSAFSMVELIFGMATCTILFAALASAMIIATKAMPDADSPLAAPRWRGDRRSTGHRSVYRPHHHLAHHNHGRIPGCRSQ